jgi:hypothetical protein
MKVQAFQFFSRCSIPTTKLGKREISPKQHPEIKYRLNIGIEDKPFEINFVQVIPSAPSIGAAQYVDPEVDVYMTRRWPKCLKIEGTIDVLVTSGGLSVEVITQLLTFLRLCLWTSINVTGISNLIQDQYSRTIGYRREYFDKQIFDISGNRRPNSKGCYVPTEVGELIGPGLASLIDLDPFDNFNELVWSSIIPFPNRSSLAADLPRIREISAAIRKHYNSYNELADANHHLSDSDLKGAVRSAASAIDAILRYYCELWNVSFPKTNKSFDEKIEDVLLSARKPSYRVMDPNNLQNILYLYRCRNSMHEGDCYYNNDSEQRIVVRSKIQVQDFISAVENFIIWIDSLV